MRGPGPASLSFPSWWSVVGKRSGSNPHLAPSSGHGLPHTSIPGSHPYMSLRHRASPLTLCGVRLLSLAVPRLPAPPRTWPRPGIMEGSVQVALPSHSDSTGAKPCPDPRPPCMARPESVTSRCPAPVWNLAFFWGGSVFGGTTIVVRGWVGCLPSSLPVHEGFIESCHPEAFCMYCDYSIRLLLGESPLPLLRDPWRWLKPKERCWEQLSRLLDLAADPASRAQCRTTFVLGNLRSLGGVFGGGSGPSSPSADWAVPAQRAVPMGCCVGASDSLGGPQDKLRVCGGGSYW
jgi:hypothetical protein